MAGIWVDSGHNASELRECGAPMDSKPQAIGLGMRSCASLKSPARDILLRPLGQPGEHGIVPQDAIVRL
jgi:hypothetical protein